MKNLDNLETLRGSGNVFRDLDRENADAQQFKAILAAEIIKALDREKLSVRAAHARTGFAAADFSRIRNADLGRFSMERLMAILNSLGTRIDVRVRLRRQRAGLSSSGPIRKREHVADLRQQSGLRKSDIGRELRVLE